MCAGGVEVLMSDRFRQHGRGDGRSAQALLAYLQGRAVTPWETDFTASIEAGVIDTDAGDVMNVEKVGSWPTAQRRVATLEEPG